MLQAHFSDKRVRRRRDYAHRDKISRPGAVARKYHCLELAALASKPAFLALGRAFDQDLHGLTKSLAIDLSGDAFLQSDDLLQPLPLLFFRRRLAPFVG